MSNAPQGPGWWQASDGNWYPPQQQPGYAAPPPPPPASAAPPRYQPPGQAAETPGASPPPQSWPAPAANPQYPPAGGQTFGTGSTAFTNAAANLPLAAWLFLGGLAVALISIFLPWVTASAEGLSATLPLSGVDKFMVFALIVGSAVLVWLTYARPRTQQATLIGLTVLIGLLTIDMLIDWFSAGAGAAGASGDLSGVNISPSAGLLLYTAAVVFLAVRIVLVWINRSKAQTQAY